MTNTSFPKSITKPTGKAGKAAKSCGSTFYEMWNDGSRDFKVVVKRMLRLGYKIKIIAIERDHQQNQYIGTKSNIL